MNLGQFLGLGKTKFNSSVCLIDENTNETELLLTERLNRKKNSGAWPELALKKLIPKINREFIKIGENRDVVLPSLIEELQNNRFPFFEYLKKNQLDIFLSKVNPNIQFIPHHLSHAYAALALSPFEKAIIVVMDGAGTEESQNEYEECSVFLHDGVKLVQVLKRTVSFEQSKNYPGQTFGNRTGSTYEKVSEYIFNSPHSSGKVMGLASFGNKTQIKNYVDFQENLPWDNSFKGKSKKEWEKLSHNHFIEIAASVQYGLEQDYGELIGEIKKNYPEYSNLILTGGCALNCTNNARLLYQNLFEKIYVPPFPGDEGIGFGVAHYLKYQNQPSSWSPVPFENQSAYLGPIDSIPSNENIEKEFNSIEFEITRPEDIIFETAKLLQNGKIIAWFQGRSESGPRALGNRSILVRPDLPELKNYLNDKIKFRESFRPYGCSVLHDKAHIYFDVAQGFDNPYMSYAIKIRAQYKDLLKEVTHVDGTSRMQTVRTGQNKMFYELLDKYGQLSGHYCLLNTSLNVMDEPILENINDAKRFLQNVPVDYLVIGKFIIRKKN